MTYSRVLLLGQIRGPALSIRALRRQLDCTAARVIAQSLITRRLQTLVAVERVANRFVGEASHPLAVVLAKTFKDALTAALSLRLLRACPLLHLQRVDFWTRPELHLHRALLIVQTVLLITLRPHAGHL